MEYVDLKYKPGKDEFIVEYYLEPNKISLEKACGHIAGESSIGTWTDIKTMNPKIARKLKPHVFKIRKREKIIEIAYPLELFEPGNIPQLMSSVAGNIFGMKAVKNLRLEDIDFPRKYIRSFKGPAFGIQGVRKMLGVKERPLVGTIVKPKVGLNPKQHAKVAYEAWVGGCDLVKDDENLSSMSFNNFRERVFETLKMKNRAEEDTGEIKAYLPNITSETFQMLERMQFVRESQGNYIMVDILTIGWSALQTVREKSFLPIHAHRAMHAALTKNPKHGISMLVLAKLSRLIGVDTLHVGTCRVGKMIGGAEETLDIEEEMKERIIPKDIEGHVLEEDWLDIKPTFAVASGGLHPGSIAKLISKMGKNIVIQAGGGIHGHPDGTRSGAKAMRQAVEAVMEGMTLKEYGKTHIELKKAIDKWGC